MTLTHNQLNREPGELRDSKFREDFYADRDTGFLIGNGSDTVFITPSIESGEIYEIRLNIIFSAEPSGSEGVEVSIQDEAQDTTLLRGYLDNGSGNQIEMHGIITGEMADAGSTPDITFQSIDNYQSNYFITVQAIRLRNPSNDQPISYESSESFDLEQDIPGAPTNP